ERLESLAGASRSLSRIELAVDARGAAFFILQVGDEQHQQNAHEQDVARDPHDQPGKLLVEPRIDASCMARTDVERIQRATRQADARYEQTVRQPEQERVPQPGRVAEPPTT